MKYRVKTIAVAVLLTVTASAQTENAFQTSSSLIETGSRYQSAAVTGINMADETDGIGMAGPRHAAMDNAFGDQTIGGNPNEPGNNTPVGDAVPFLLVLAAGYGLTRKLRTGRNR